MKILYLLSILALLSINNFSQNNSFQQWLSNRVQAETAYEIYLDSKEIYAAIDNNHLHEAIGLINRFLEKYPTEKYMYYTRGFIKVMLNEMSAAKKDFHLFRESGFGEGDSLVEFWLSKESAANMLAEGYIENARLKKENDLKPVFTRADTLQGALRPERTCFDVTSYDLNVRLLPHEQKIAGKNLIYFNTLSATNKIQLDLFQNYSIDSVILNGHLLNYKRDHNAIFIEMPEQLSAKKKYCIQINYSGKPRIAPNPPWNGGFVWRKNKKKDWIGVACEHLGASSWWPNKDHLSDKPDSMRITVEVPNDLVAVSNGVLKSTTQVDENYTAYEWFVSYPINNYNVTLYAGDFVQFSETFTNNKGSYNIDYYVQPKNLNKAKEYYAQTKDVLSVFEKVFGEYPFKNDGVAMVEAPYTGMEHQGAIAIGDDYGEHPRRSYEDKNYDYLVVHETAHEWWGNAVAIGDMADAWINEGFATYAELMFMEEMNGYDAYIDGTANVMQTIFNIWPLVGIRNVNDNTFLSGDIYHKGAIMLHCLRCSMDNDSLFKQLIKDFYNAYKYKICDTDDFLNFVTQYTNKSYLPLLKTFLYNADPPLLSSAFIKDGNDLLFYYRFSEVEEGFEMPFNIITDKYESIRLIGKEKLQFIRIKDAVSYYIPTGYLHSKGMKENSFTYFFNDRLVLREIKNLYANGNLKEKGLVVGKFKHEDWEYYYPEGNIKNRINYNCGKFDGEYESYSENGEIEFVKTYKMDILYAYTKYENTLVKYRETYENGIVDSVFYYNNGLLESCGKISNKKESGTWKIYHPNGILAASVEFNNGTPESTGIKYFDNSGNHLETVDTVLTNSHPPAYREGTGKFYSDVNSGLVLKTEQLPEKSGTAYISFLVSPLGVLSDFKQENQYHTEFGNAIIERIKILSRWVPGYFNGKPVYTKVIYPFKYTKEPDNSESSERG